MSESAPTNRPVNLFFCIACVAVILAMAALVVLNYQHRTVTVAKKAPVAVVTPAPVIAPDAPTYEQVVATPLAEKPEVVAPIQAPVKVVPVVTPAVTAPVHVTPAPTVCHPDAPNHGNFIHGNSNPCWPYTPSHHCR